MRARALAALTLSAPGSEAAQRMQATDAVFVAVLVALASIFYLDPSPYVYVPALAAVGALSVLRLDLALVLVVLFCPMFMHPKHIGRERPSPSEVFLLIDLVALLLYALWPSRRKLVAWNKLLRSAFSPPALVFLLAACLSTLAAAQRHLALTELREVVVEPLLFFALLLLLFFHAWQWRLLVFSLLAAGFWVGLVGLVDFASHQNLSLSPGTSLQRVRSVYGSPDNLGLLYDRVVPVWFAVVTLWSLARLRRLLLIKWLVFVPVLFLTFSRGAWVATGLSCLFVLAIGFSWGRWVLVAILAVAAGLFAVEGPALAHKLGAGHTNTAQRRVDLWTSSVNMLKDHPILGVGPDNFQHYYAPPPQIVRPHAGFSYRLRIGCRNGLGYMKAEASAEPCLSHPHNEILDVWLRTGLLGLAAFVWLQVVFWRTARDAWRGLLALPDRALAVGAMGGMLATLLHGLVDNSYFLSDLALIFWTLCALVSFLASAPPERVFAASPYGQAASR